MLVVLENDLVDHNLKKDNMFEVLEIYNTAELHIESYDLITLNSIVSDGFVSRVMLYKAPAKYFSIIGNETSEKYLRTNLNSIVGPFFSDKTK